MLFIEYPLCSFKKMLSYGFKDDRLVIPVVPIEQTP